MANQHTLKLAQVCKRNPDFDTFKLISKNLADLLEADYFTMFIRTHPQQS